MIRRFRPADVILVMMLGLYLWPIWSVRRLATQDGPSHVYNAYLLAQLVTTPPPRTAEVFAVRWEPVPNCLGHVSLTGLILLGLPPLLAEKVFVSLYIAGVALGTRFLLRAVAPGQDVWAALALPLAYHFVFFMGFYNFLCGIPLVLVLLGLAWRWRNQPSFTHGVVLSILLVTIYLSHLVAFGAGVVALVVISLIGSNRRWTTALMLLLALVPSLDLVVWYVTSSDVTYLDNAPLWKMIADSSDSPEKLLSRFTAAVLTPTPLHQSWIALGVVGLLAIGTLDSAAKTLEAGGRRAYLRFWANKGAFFAASVELLILSLFLPQSWGHHGGVFTERLAVFAALLSLAWLPLPVTRWSKAFTLALVVVIGLANLVPVSGSLRRGEQELERLLAELPRPAEGTRVLPLFFHARPKDEVRLLEHLTAYLCLRPGIVNWDNYEARGFCFPVMFRPDVKFSDLDRVMEPEYTGADIDLGLVDMAIVGPKCPSTLVDRISAALPHQRICGEFRVYSRTRLPQADANTVSRTSS